MNVSLHVDAFELAVIELAARKYVSNGRRLVTVNGGAFSAWVSSADEARQVAEAWLQLAADIELDDLHDRHAAMHPLLTDGKQLSS
jgi:hypothetical protein